MINVSGALPVASRTNQQTNKPASQQTSKVSNQSGNYNSAMSVEISQQAADLNQPVERNAHTYLAHMVPLFTDRLENWDSWVQNTRLPQLERTELWQAMSEEEREHMLTLEKALSQAHLDNLIAMRDNTKNHRFRNAHIIPPMAALQNFKAEMHTKHNVPTEQPWMLAQMRITAEQHMAQLNEWHAWIDENRRRQGLPPIPSPTPEDDYSNLEVEEGREGGGEQVVVNTDTFSEFVASHNQSYIIQLLEQFTGNRDTSRNLNQLAEHILNPRE